ncbi:Wzz/FepE/Etk N-terminal domain-containing protein [Aquibium sp. A9E412]|uniref:GumC family protein n=1 Tax=Aquibium sp. A9E412 TaxID=2976767 RepID=UPI0025B20412|nr:Wzz/FepE/Etk N-terminal domain-containing protein [Aquibium sp. A9E412]MDN2564935.1 Wzz/FepE/Etk N-terminal domain-containing protein [Aquibium sp. A9E412]
MDGDRTLASDVDIDFGKLFSAVVGRWRQILLAALAVAGLVFLFAWLATPLYRAETRLLIETRESVYTRPAMGEGDRPILDEEGVTSQVEVITSTDILKQVARELELAERAEFEQGEVSLPGRMLIVAGLKSDPRGIPPEQRVLSAFREKLQVYRVENSRVIVIRFSSEDRALAAEVPNAIAEAYLEVQRQAKLASNADATAWLEPEIADLRARVREAEERVAAFRASSDLLIGQNNAVLATQQLSELSTELSRVRANRAAAEATAAAVRGALQEGASIDTMPDVLASPLIQRLRERQVELRAEIADLSTTLLDNHPRIRALRSQLGDLDAQIRSEAGKVREALETEAETARLRERDLTEELNTLKAESARADGEQVELRALEREAAAQRELLESYLTRYREASARRDRNYLPADARIFSRAVVPSEPYFPKILPLTVAAFFAGLLLAVIVTLLRELFSGRAMRPADGAFAPVETIAMPVAAAPAEPQADAAPEDQADAPAARGIAAPAAAEALIAGGVTRALFVSPEGDEAAAAAILVAREVADAGLRVLLLDLTATGAASWPTLESVVYPGITDLLASQAQFADVIHGDLYSDCHVIPIGTASPARAMRAIDRLPIIMDSLTTAYDMVIVECGPVEAPGLTRLLDESSAVLVSLLEASQDALAETVETLQAAGLPEPAVVTPTGASPRPATPGRSAA